MKLFKAEITLGDLVTIIPLIVFVVLMKADVNQLKHTSSEHTVQLKEMNTGQVELKIAVAEVRAVQKTVGGTK